MSWLAMSSDPMIIPVVLPLIDAPKILDVGCGKGKWGYIFRVDCQSFSPVKSSPSLIVGADIFPPYLKYVKHHRVYDLLVLCAATHLPFRKKSFQIVFAGEVLEHMSKSDGEKMLIEIERVSSRRVIVTTPLFPFKQGESHKNPYQKHVSRWSVGEFKKRGYKVRGCGAFLIKGGKAIHKLSYLPAPLATIFPWFAYILIATKIIE